MSQASLLCFVQVHDAVNDFNRRIPAEEGDLVRELLGRRVRSSLTLFALLIGVGFVLSRRSLRRFPSFHGTFWFIFYKPEAFRLLTTHEKRSLFSEHSLQERNQTEKSNCEESNCAPGRWQNETQLSFLVLGSCQKSSESP